MNLPLSIVLTLTFAFSFVLVGIVRRIAVHRNLIDVPNERSSHTVPTPRGGGVAIAAAFVIALTVLLALRLISEKIWLSLLISGCAVAGIGYVDDRHHLRASTRFAVHFAAAVFFVLMVGGYPEGELMKWAIHGFWLNFTFSVIVVIWATNLFNFMDGIDGIAASEATFISMAGGWLNWLNRGDLGMTALLLALSASSFGFLCWNWPPARIFMGDVGSGFLGFILAAALMVATSGAKLPIEVIPILSGVFVVDATVTLVRRILQGDRWLEPHRTHAYQLLSKRLGQHRAVTMIVVVINVFWLLPWAYAVTQFPLKSRLYMLAALLPLVIACTVIGAGKRER